MKKILIAMGALLAAVAFADVILKNHGSTVGPVQSVNCGNNATCTRSGSTGTISISFDAGSGVIDVTASSPLASSGGLTPDISLTGTIPVNKGGTNLTGALDDNVMVGNGSTWQTKAIADCTDTVGQHLNYTASTNSFACGTSTSSTAAGTVTDVSVVTANGVSGSVATSTSTPAITLALGDITPTSVNASTGAITGGVITANTSIHMGTGVLYDDNTYTYCSNPFVVPNIILYSFAGFGGLDLANSTQNYILSETPDSTTSASVAAMSFQQSGTLTSGDLSFDWQKAGGTQLCKLANTGALTCIGSVTGSNLSGTNTGDQTITLTGAVTGSGTGSFATSYGSVVPVAKGGTNSSTALPSSGGVVWNNGTAILPIAAGTAANCLLSGGAGAPTWGSCSSGSGTVTSVSVTTANGVSGSVANATTTPAITLTLGAITPSSVNTSSGAITGGTITANAGFVTGTSTISDDTTYTTISNPLITQYLITTVAGLEMSAASSNIISSDTADANTSSTVAALEFLNSSTLTAGDLSFGWKTGSTRLCKMTNQGAFNCIAGITGSNLSGTNTGDQTITLTGGVTGSGTGSFAATVVTNANLTGAVTSVGNATSYATTVPVNKGGTNLTAATDDEVMVGNGTTWQSKAIPNCADSAGNHLNYTASSNTFSCGTSSPDRISTASWSAYCPGYGVTSCPEITNFLGPVHNQNGTLGKITCNWGTAGNGAENVVMRVVADPSGTPTEVCKCTIGLCNATALTPKSCTCLDSGSPAGMSAGVDYVLQLSADTACTGNVTPKDIFCNVEYTP